MPPGLVIVIETKTCDLVMEMNQPDRGCGWLVLKVQVEV
jgi:hypothetical protein